MTSKEKDSLVGEKVLGFDCFSNDEDIKWFDYHYKMGFWHFTSNLRNSIELAEKLSQQNAIVEIKILNPRTIICCITSTKDKKISYSATATSIPEAICLAALYYSGVEIN
jgi:Phage ABA sandwich domain